MKRLTIIMMFAATSVASLAQNAFVLHGQGSGTGIGEVKIEATRSGENVRGRFSARVRTEDGPLAIRGEVVRLAADPNRARVFHFVAHCTDSTGKRFLVEGSCLDGPNPERDDIVFSIGTGARPVFRGSTDRQIVNVRRPRN